MFCSNIASISITKIFLKMHRLYLVNTVIILVLCGCGVLLLIPNGDALLSADVKWTHELTLETGFQIRWDGEDPDFLTMEMSAPTTGYLGLGFSPNGDMDGSDIVIAWVDSNGIPHIKDYHGVGKMEPVEDPQQDYFLIAAAEKDNQTTIRFHRRWETCDELNDISIGNDTMRLIWSWHPDDPTLSSFSADPADGGLNSFPWHGATTRGTLHVHVRLPNRPLPFPDGDDGLATPPKDIKVWDLTVENVDIDGSKNSLFICKLFKFPIPNRKKIQYQLIGFRPLITVENDETIHGISLYQCHIPPNTISSTDSQRWINHEEILQNGEAECNEGRGDQNTTSSWVNNCTQLVLSWAMGSEGEMLPAHVGMLSEDLHSSTLFKLEVHYDNLFGKQVLDSSGIRLFFTDEERLYSGGVLSVGHQVSPFLAVPPSQENFKIYSVCSSGCTTNGIPERGINVFSVMLHSHATGRKIRLRHIRNGKELSPIAEDSNYIYKYQQHRRMKNEVRIFPGDELILECDYNTLNRDKFTFGGYTNQEENCQALLHYYPKGNLTLCESKPEYQSFFGGFGISNVMGEGLMRIDHHLPPQEGSDLLSPQFLLEQWPRPEEDWNPFGTVFITSPHSSFNHSVAQRMNNFDWRLKHVAKNLENSWRNGRHFMYCEGLNGPIPHKKSVGEIPRFQKYNKISNSICRRPSQRSGTNSTTTAETVLIIAFALVSKIIFDGSGYLVN